MPGRDGTGPRGQGSRTGWGRGACTPNASKELTAASYDDHPLGFESGRMWKYAFGWWFRRRRGNRNK